MERKKAIDPHHIIWDSNLYLKECQSDQILFYSSVHSENILFEYLFLLLIQVDKALVHIQNELLLNFIEIQDLKVKVDSLIL